MALTPQQIRSQYREALLEARRVGFALTRRGEQRLLATYAEMLVRIQEDVEAGIITRERAARLYEQTVSAMVRFQRAMVDLSEAGKAATALTIQQIHQAVIRDLFRSAGFGSLDTVQAMELLDAVQADALAVMAARGETASAFQTLARRKVVASADELQVMLQGAVARGVDAGRAAIDVARLLAGDNPVLIAGLNKLGVTRQLAVELREGASAVPLEAYGIEAGDVRELRTLLYDARRIVVTESNNAMREANTQALFESPVITAAKWQVSGRHNDLDPDECDVLATADFYGLGPGIYPTGKWPLAPHPHCGCTQGGPVTIRSPLEWSQPKPEAPSLQVAAGDPEHFDRFDKSWTPARRQRAESMVRQTIGEVERGSRLRRRAAG